MNHTKHLRGVGGLSLDKRLPDPAMWHSVQCLKMVWVCYKRLCECGALTGSSDRATLIDKRAYLVSNLGPQASSKNLKKSQKISKSLKKSQKISKNLKKSQKISKHLRPGNASQFNFSIGNFLPGWKISKNLKKSQKISKNLKKSRNTKNEFDFASLGGKKISKFLKFSQNFSKNLKKSQEIKQEIDFACCGSLRNRKTFRNILRRRS